MNVPVFPSGSPAFSCGSAIIARLTCWITEWILPPVLFLFCQSECHSRGDRLSRYGFRWQSSSGDRLVSDTDGDNGAASRVASVSSAVHVVVSGCLEPRFLRDMSLIEGVITCWRNLVHIIGRFAQNHDGPACIFGQNIFFLLWTTLTMGIKFALVYRGVFSSAP